jgi:succinate dehydrogenase/fumarate reductase cytochrome b subunit
MRTGTGYATHGQWGPPAQAVLSHWHDRPVMDALLILCFCFNGCCGLRTVLFDVRLGREKTLFWTAAAVVLPVTVVLVFYCGEYTGQH